jgi:hypothetical protein
MNYEPQKTKAMKTKAFFSVISLAMIFAAAAAGFASNKDGLQAKASTAGITYKVMIHSDMISNPSGTYVIMILNESGNLVAPAQAWIPGVNIYTFREKVSGAPNPGARRIAKFVPVKPSYLPNSPLLHAAPAVLVGPFLSGKAYFFNLFIKPAVRTLD